MELSPYKQGETHTNTHAHTHTQKGFQESKRKLTFQSPTGTFSVTKTFMKTTSTLVWPNWIFFIFVVIIVFVFLSLEINVRSFFSQKLFPEAQLFLEHTQITAQLCSLRLLKHWDGSEPRDDFIYGKRARKAHSYTNMELREAGEMRRLQRHAKADSWHVTCANG